MLDSAFAHGPAVPWAGTFLETNVRLDSVDATGRRGIVFLGLDTDRSVVVAGARAILGLPYRWARMRHHTRGPERTYTARLPWPGVRARSRIVVRAGDPAAPTALDASLTALGPARRPPGTHLVRPRPPPHLAPAPGNVERPDPGRLRASSSTAHRRRGRPRSPSLHAGLRGG
ncbi:DUF2071 domain-containing protein [Pseudonocardia artemisiae]